VRRATVADAPAVAEVHTRSWRSAYEHVFGAERLAGIDAARRAAAWERAIASGEDVFVAEQDDRVVAFVSVGPSRDGEAHGELFAVYAVPEAWGSGAGPALMRAGVEALRAAGFREAVLWVLDDNPRARRFYEREGWEPDGARKEDEFLGVRVAEVRYRIVL
jgi:RimJ/RimL family protein N-acetyltransferase